MNETAPTIPEPEAFPVAVPVVSPSGIAAAPAQFGEDLAQIRTLLAGAQSRLETLENAVDATSKQVSFLPAQLRMLAGKIDGQATAISEPRYRGVLLGLLGVYDLVDQMLRASPAGSDTDADHRRNYEVIHSQLRQTLEVNGLSEIPAAGAFDPKLHRAMQRVPCTDPAQANQILQVVRAGFRTEQTVLRYAEVLVGHYSPPEESRPSGSPDSLTR